MTRTSPAASAPREASTPYWPHYWPTLRRQPSRHSGRRRSTLGETVHAAATASNDAGAGLLGKRQAEVARLVADGLTNKQIGTRLFVPERTVDSHVRSGAPAGCSPCTGRAYRRPPTPIAASDR